MHETSLKTNKIKKVSFDDASDYQSSVSSFAKEDRQKSKIFEAMVKLIKDD